MKKITLIALAIFFAAAVYAQYNGYFSSDVYTKGKKYSGWIILKNGEKKEGFIEARDPVANQQSVHFYNSLDGDKEKYGPKELKEYQLGHLHYIVSPYSGGIVSKDQFILVQKEGEGALKSCYWYSVEVGQIIRARGANETEEQYFNAQYPSEMVYYREGLKPVEHKMLAFGFADKMAKLTEEVPEISKKIAQKEKGYKMINLFDIIKEFNEQMAIGK